MTRSTKFSGAKEHSYPGWGESYQNAHVAISNTILGNGDGYFDNQAMPAHMFD
jgi:hypothetical protein